MNARQIQLETIYFDQQMSCIDIIQCIIEEHKLSGVYTCGECKEKLSCESEVWTHIPTHFNFGQPVPIVHRIEMYMVEYEAELDPEPYPEPEPEPEPVQENVGTGYECMICNMRYNTHIALSNHIYNDHNNYNDLLALDNKPVSDAFPGFDIMIHINMIRYVDQRIGMKKKIDRCCLCYEQYNDFKRANCTMDISNQRTTSIKKKVFRCDQMIGTHSKYYDELKKIVPIEMKCCRANMCTECMKSHINSKQDLVCPFCNQNHTQYNKRFIIFDERPYEKIRTNPDPYPRYPKTRRYESAGEPTTPNISNNNSSYRQFVNDYRNNINIVFDENTEDMFETYQLALIQMMEMGEIDNSRPIGVAERVD